MSRGWRRLLINLLTRRCYSISTVETSPRGASCAPDVRISVNMGVKVTKVEPFASLLGF
jgi:hypothetical protein